MANVNKLILIGNLTRDPEVRTFGSGGRVANFGIAVNSRRFNQQTNQWEDGDAMFLDCEAFNRGEYGKLADRIEQTLKKGVQVYLEGRLRLDQWDDKATGQKRSKHKMVVENLQTFGARSEGGEGGGGYNRGPAQSRSGPSQAGNYDNSSADDYDSGNSGGGGGKDEEIPF